jgi:hypothetical protein
LSFDFGEALLLSGLAALPIAAFARLLLGCSLCLAEQPFKTGSSLFLGLLQGFPCLSKRVLNDAFALVVMISAFTAPRDGLRATSASQEASKAPRRKPLLRACFTIP